MFLALHKLGKIFSSCQILVLACLCATAFSITPSYADSSTAYALGQALSANDHVDLYGANDKPFKLGSSYYAGLASPSDSVANLNSDQRLYALLIDGRYDFNYETSSLSGPIHPYISGGMGMATAGNVNVANNLTTGNNGVVPLFRLGGGVAYRLDQRWNLSLDYKAGLASSTAGDQVFTGRSQQSVDLQALNLGMSYAF